MNSAIEKTLKKIKDEGLFRSLTLIEGPQSPRVRISGKEVLCLCSNDYLGLANHPEVKEAAIKATERYGAGAGASRLTSGAMEPHRELEDRIKRFKKAEAALVFNSGWHANTGIIPAMAGRGADVFSDRLNHASIIDGSILGRANLRRYPHGDVNALEGLLGRSTAERKLIVTDGVFSMDGDVAPLKEIIALAERHGAMVFLDDAHAVGCIGKNGRGTLEHLGIERRQSVIEAGTLGKAFGSYGAFVTGGRELMELLMNRARSFIYSTALPPGVCAASSKAIEIAGREPQRRKRLSENAAFMRDGLRKNGFDTLKSSTHIIPLVTGKAQRTMEITGRLLDSGVFVQGIRPPTVPQGTSRLRITVSSEHKPADLERAIEVIARACE
ncbi:MAG: 8-amino-7-oxononanoate synthase [Deltaproteobacteria bacterium]|nr:8-amino-7-oxononanoate synthase [Deltaproteobacteria bacterium]